MAETNDETDLRPETAPSDKRVDNVATAIADGLLQLHAAPDKRALAAAFAALARAIQPDTEACLFLDDGSGALLPLESEEPQAAIAALRLSTLEEGPVTQVCMTGEAIVLDDIAELFGDPAPPLPGRRILLARLRWQEETLGVALFCSAGYADLGLYLQIADHASLALVKLRALDKSVRFGGIDPSLWLFDREWLKLRLEDEVQRALRYDRPLTLLLCAFNGLDELARQAGAHQTEVFLRRVGAIARGQIRGHDVLAGHGNASIAVLLPETDREGAAVILGRIASRVGSLKPTGHDIASAPTLLVGTATCPADASSATELIAAAESRLAPFADESGLQATA